MKTRACWISHVIILIILIGSAGRPALAQEPKSAALAKELVTLLDRAKLDAIAAKETPQGDTYYAALYFAGSQLLVVSARYSVPVILNEKLEKKEYRDIYMDLNSASIPDSKVFIVDLGANGLRPRREENEPFDTYETAKVQLAFDGDWKRHKMTEEEYLKHFTEADERYARILTGLIAQLKKG